MNGSLTVDPHARSDTPHFHVAIAAAGTAGTGVTCTAADFERLSQQLRALESEAQATAALVELMTTIGDSTDVKSACCALVNHVGDYLGCDRVAVAICRKPNASCHLAAISGMAEFDAGADIAVALQAAIDECIVRDVVTVFPAETGEQCRGALAHRGVCRMAATGGAISSPLRSAGGTVIGAWILLGPAEFVRNLSSRRFVETSSTPLGTSLSAIQKAESSRVGQIGRRLWASLPLRSPALILCLLTAAIGVLFVPFPYTVSVECEIQPAVRRYVAAPHAGIFARSLVKPGDVVRREQSLGRMEGREVRLELAALDADWQRAAKSHDVSIAGNKLAAAQIDGLEMRRIDLKRALLADRSEHLDIKSPIDGIVVSSDLGRCEGMPVTVGQVLYEVAPLAEMIAEVAIPDEEVSRVRSAMPVRIYVDSQPGMFRVGQLQNINPRSTVRERDNVFIGEVTLDNREATLRPGMKGLAKITMPPRSIGWVLFHKPWDYLMTWWGS